MIFDNCFEDLIPERKLWKYVILHATKEAAKDKEEADRVYRSWVRTKSFKTVCALAGFNHEYVEMSFKELINDEVKRRKTRNIIPNIRGGEYGSFYE